MECNPVLQQLEEERRQAKEAKFYIGDISLEDIQDFEETALSDQVQDKSEQAAGGLGSDSEKTKLYVGDLEDIWQFEETGLISDSGCNCRYSDLSLQDDDTQWGLDTILKEAIEDYETRLSPAGD